LIGFAKLSSKLQIRKNERCISSIASRIDSKIYQVLPDREKPNWHYHKEEFPPDRANPKFPLLNDQQQKQWLTKLSESYGKIILNWNPMDSLTTCISTTNTTSTASFHDQSDSKQPD
jgi:hypothetical protein